MSQPLTPDSPSYQEIAIHVAANDVLNHFNNLKATSFRAIVAALSPPVEALRIAHKDLINAPFELRQATISFLSAYDFVATSHPALDLNRYLQGARSRLNQAFAFPDRSLITSQEDALRDTVSDFLAAWATSKDTAASNRTDFPHLPPLPANRLHAGWVQSRQQGQAARRLRQADKALHVAYQSLTFAPAHLRLALSHFLMTFDLLKEYDDLALDRARKSLERAFDAATPPAPSAYLAEPSFASVG